MEIEIADTEEKIREFLPELDRMVQDGLVTLETIEVIRYRADSEKAGKRQES